jgi:hypothetical protein
VSGLSNKEELAGHLARMEGKRNACSFWSGNVKKGHGFEVVGVARKVILKQILNNRARGYEIDSYSLGQRSETTCCK